MKLVLFQVSVTIQINHSSFQIIQYLMIVNVQMNVKHYIYNK